MLTRKSGVSWIEPIDQLCDEEQPGAEPAFPFLFDFDASFIDGYSRAEDCNHGQSVSVSTHGILQPITTLPKSYPHVDRADLPSVVSAIPSTISLSPKRVHSTLRDTLHWVNGDQWRAHGTASTSNTRYDHHAPMSSDFCPAIGEPAGLELFNPDSGSDEVGAFVDPNNTWISPPSLQIAAKIAGAARTPKSHHDFHTGAAQSNPVLEPIFDQQSGLAIPPFARLLDLEASQQGFEASQGPDNYTESELKSWFDGAIPDAILDQSSRTLVSYETGNDLPSTSQDLEVETSRTTNEHEAILAPVASTAITKAGRRRKAPNADLTLLKATGKFATSRLRKPFSKERRQEVALTRQIGACFRCKVAKVTVCSIQKR